MTDFVKGKVTDILERETSIGTMYDIVINGTKYGAGKYKPSVKVGQYVKAPIKQNGKYANIFGKIQVVDAADVGGDTGGSAPARASAGGYVGDDKRQEIISRQAARNTAVAFLEILVAKDAVPMPASAKTPAQRFDVLNTFLNGLTEDFNNYALGKKKATKPDADDGEEEAGADEGDFS